MFAVYHPIYSSLALPDGHRFPIKKYQWIRQQLLEQHILTEDQLHQPDPISRDSLIRLHCPDYVDAVINGQLDRKAIRRIGFPWSSQLVQRSLTSVGGTLLTCELALQQGQALHLSGGYHHAHHDFGSGFCLFNDLALAALTMIEEHQLSRVLIFDCDVHQGDGTAALLAGNDSVITCSLHCGKNFPARKQQSDIDFEFDKATTDDEYLATTVEIFEYCLNTYQPDLVIYDAGVDIHQSDVLGLLNVSTEGIYQRDHLILDQCRQRQIPVAAVTGGGYHEDQHQLVPLHLQLFKAAKAVNEKRNNPCL